MLSILETNREAIASTCARHRVKSLYAFGSAVRDDFKPGISDIDMLVDFMPMEPYDRVDAYFGMLDALRKLTGINVDLVMVGAVKNPYIARDIERTKQVLYAT